MDQKKKTNTKHPLICPKCKYSRPLGLSYCPHCRELETKPKGLVITEKLQKMGVNIGDAKILPSNNTADVRPSNKGENTQQKKPKATNRQVFSKQQSVPRARKRTTKKSS